MNQDQIALTTESGSITVCALKRRGAYAAHAATEPDADGACAVTHLTTGLRIALVETLSDAEAVLLAVSSISIPDDVAAGWVNDARLRARGIKPPVRTPEMLAARDALAEALATCGITAGAGLQRVTRRRIGGRT